MIFHAHNLLIVKKGLISGGVTFNFLVALSKKERTQIAQ